MFVKESVLRVMEEVSGISQEELQENMDLDLYENELLDSLGIITLLEELSMDLKCEFDVGKVSADDFRTMNAIIATVEGQL